MGYECRGQRQFSGVVMVATDVIVIAVIFAILVACLVFDLWVRHKEDQ